MRMLLPQLAIDQSPTNECVSPGGGYDCDAASELDDIDFDSDDEDDNVEDEKEEDFQAELRALQSAIDAEITNDLFGIDMNLDDDILPSDFSA